MNGSNAGAFLILSYFNATLDFGFRQAAGVIVEFGTQGCGGRRMFWLWALYDLTQVLPPSCCLLRGGSYLGALDR